MSLKGNYSLIHKNPSSYFSGTHMHRSAMSTPGRARSRYSHAEMDRTASVPPNYAPPVSWMIPQDSGAISSINNVEGAASVEAALASGKAMTSDLAGVGSMSSANLKLVVSLISDLAGSGLVSSAALNSSLAMAAALIGSGSISAGLNVLAYCVAAISGTGTVAATGRGQANMSADVLPYTELSPQALAAAVWEAVASEFNAAGTMGEKLNDAGSSGNPWASLLDDNNDPGTFGERVQKLLTVAKFLGLK